MTQHDRLTKQYEAKGMSHDEASVRAYDALLDEPSMLIKLLSFLHLL